jgi:hypothetical protein
MLKLPGPGRERRIILRMARRTDPQVVTPDILQRSVSPTTELLIQAARRTEMATNRDQRMSVRDDPRSEIAQDGPQERQRRIPTVRARKKWLS